MTQMGDGEGMQPSADRDPQTYAIIGAAMEVHTTLGCGFLEAVYQDALEREFIDRGIPYSREEELRVPYKGKLLPSRYRADFICHGCILVETKALKKLTEIEDAQVLNYLKILQFHRALLFNFGAVSLEYRRFVHGRPLPFSSV